MPNAQNSLELVPEIHPEIVPEERESSRGGHKGLCLSGGGYRAMLFHVGAILRLNECGILRTLSRISSVSGGSITAGVLGMNWSRLTFGPAGDATNLHAMLVDPIQRMADVTIDVSSILGGIALPGSISNWITDNYRDRLYGDATLQSLPSDADGPRFVFNATSVQTGALVRMSKPYLADYRVGMIPNPEVSLAAVVAASSAFPPLLSPARIDVNPADFIPDSTCPLQRVPYTETLILTDGGVYDNLGLETVWKNCETVYVSDGGGQMHSEESPASDWVQHSKRTLDLIDNQVRSLRKRQLIGSYVTNVRTGAYWGIRSNLENFKLADVLEADLERTTELAKVGTRLEELPRETQEHLMNWGYAVCDAAVRKHASDFVAAGSPEAKYPFASGLG